MLGGLGGSQSFGAAELGWVQGWPGRSAGTGVVVRRGQGSGKQKPTPSWKAPGLARKARVRGHSRLQGGAVSSRSWSPHGLRSRSQCVRPLARPVSGAQTLAAAAGTRSLGPGGAQPVLPCSQGRGTPGSRPCVGRVSLHLAQGRPVQHWGLITCRGSFFSSSPGTGRPPAPCGVVGHRSCWAGRGRRWCSCGLPSVAPLGRAGAGVCRALPWPRTEGRAPRLARVCSQRTETPSARRSRPFLRHCSYLQWKAPPAPPPGSSGGSPERLSCS